MIRKTLFGIFNVVITFCLLAQALNTANQNGLLVRAQVSTASVGTSLEEFKSEDYPTLPESLNFAVSEVLTPFQTKEFPDPIYGVSFDLKGVKSLNNIFFRFLKGDDTYTGYLQAIDAEGYFGNAKEKANPAVVSTELYAFDKGIKKVEIYSSEDIVIKINSFKFDNAVGKAATQSPSPESLMQKKLFQSFGLNLILRTDWGGDAISGWAPDIVKVNRVVVHHTATSVDMNNPKNTVKAIWNFHKMRCSNNVGSYDPNNPDCNEPDELWQDIGYNYLIDPYGNIYEGRAGGNGVIGAHAPPNSGSIGISILGNYTGQDPTAAAMSTLKTLITKLSVLNNFSIQFENGLYGHKDINSTACPARIENLLPSVDSSVNTLKTKENGLNKTKNLVTNLTKASNKHIKRGNNAEVIVNISGLDSATKTDLASWTAPISSKKTIGSTLIYYINENLLSQTLAQLQQIVPSATPQPNFIYKKTSWDNTNPARSIPSDYDQTIHWNLEKIKAPEAWSNLGGCASDQSCGGSNLVVVAVLDTGVAYEDYPGGGYDAGGSYISPMPNIAGYYINIPSVDTPNGIIFDSGTGKYEGYERNYSKSPELSNVNFVHPYDVWQDYLCSLREFESNADYHCNAQEWEKKNHANDDEGHGTYVTTIIAGETGDTAPNKVVGIAHNVSIMPIKVFSPNDTSFCQDSSGNHDPTCADGLYDYRSISTTEILTQSLDYAVANDANVVNMSLSGPDTDPAFQTSIENALNAHVVLVAASGNSGGSTPGYPAAYPGVISVGASTSSDIKANYSTYGTGLDLVAPVGDNLGGSKIVSHSYQCTQDTYQSPANDDLCDDETNNNLFGTGAFSSQTSPFSMLGTSFSAPQVSAVAALIKSKRPTANATQVRDIINATAQDITSTGAGFDNQTGYGILNAEDAIDNTWGDYSQSGGQTLEPVGLASFNGRLYQAVKETSSTSKIAIRSTSDGVFDNSNPGENWSKSGINGTTNKQVSLASFTPEGSLNPYLYATVVRSDTNIYMKKMDMAGVWDATWTKTAGKSYDPIESVKFTPQGDTQERLFQVNRSLSKNYIYVRNTKDGIFDGSSSEENWVQMDGRILGEGSFTVLNNRLYLVVRNKSSIIDIRHTDDGITWSPWVTTGISSQSTPGLGNKNGKLYISVRNASNLITTMYSSNEGASWSYPLYLGGKSNVKANLVEFLGKLYEASVSIKSPYYIYTRKL